MLNSNRLDFEEEIYLKAEVEMGESREFELRTQYDQIVMERVHAMRASQSFIQMRRKWLKNWKRKAPFPDIDEWLVAERKIREEDRILWDGLQGEVASLAEMYALAPWQVLWTLFVRNYHPWTRTVEGEIAPPLPLDAWHSERRLIVLQGDSEDIRKWTSLVPDLGVHIEFRSNSEKRGDSSSIGELERFRISMAFPVEYSRELAVLETRKFMGNARELVRKYGVDVPLRARSNFDDSAVSVAIMTHCEHHDFIERLRSACHWAGIEVLHDDGRPSVAPIDEVKKTPLVLVRLLVDFPLCMKAETAVKAIRKAFFKSRECLKDAGLDLGMRQRVAPLVQHAPDLRVDGQRLDAGGLGDIVYDLYDVMPFDSFPKLGRKSNPKGQGKRLAVKSRRNQINTRLQRKGLISQK